MGLLTCLVLAVSTAPIQGQTAARPSIEDRTAGMQRMEGFFNLYWDDATGSLFWEIARLDTEFLYQVSMGSGLGSNPIGIDRGQLRGTHILEAKRVGPRVILMEPNYQYVARSENPTEVDAVRDAFAPSVHWGFDIEAATGARILVNATQFFLRDARGVIDQIAARGQGTFALDAGRSVIHMPATASFPENTEVEAMLTFTSRNPGGLVNGVAVNGEAITLRLHHSFIQLPDAGFRTRIADARVGVNGPTVYDYATPIDVETRVRFAARHRLEKANPSAARSEAVEPIIYYVDPGTPEPVRSALIEGARWWNDAFEAAGFINAFQVEVLPPGIDPQDIRYNMIHWTHRRTRGYSYGNTVTDPRTGEIVRGVVNLGSLRLRQDYLHGQGVVPPFRPGISAPQDESLGEFADAPDYEYLAQVAPASDAVEMALARVRQLSAHEVGHTIGFPHNYMASAYGRESVMDYPAPLVEIDQNGNIDLSNAYVQRIGEYDKLSVNWLYREFPAGTDEAVALGRIAQQGVTDQLIYMGHTNNNFIGAGHQYAGVWDNGSNLVDHLKLEIRVREIGLRNFGTDVIRTGEPLSNLEFVLLPLYMHHRFQLRSAVQSLGGADYRYALKGDGQTPFTIVDAAEQRDALETVLSTLAVDFLALSPEIVRMIPPPAFRHDEGEDFPGYTEQIFDPIGVAEASAAFTVGEILNPQRMARLVMYGSMGDYPTLEEVTDRLIAVTWGVAEPTNRYQQQVLHVAQRAVADQMMQQASMGGNPSEVRAILSDRLDRLADGIEAGGGSSPHANLVAADIRRWESRIENTVPGPQLQLPAGDPIGGSSRSGNGR
ncbi:MAG: zinc-dependent metalloprotease [Gemmatimonadetes bacterium]|nr:zinc-dependent metalloprotease [Gemmatimonadota bacterium]MDA1102479.1 zinc-dependent metalloprotease [Gemmatimonadota bacterium]